MHNINLEQNIITSVLTDDLEKAASTSDEGNDDETALKEYGLASKLKVKTKWDDARRVYFKALENHHDFPLK